MNNIPEVKLGIIAVSRDCFPIALSTQRRKNIVAAYGEGLYECPITVENEKDAAAAIADVRAHGVNALVVFLGNFGPETPETLLVKKFHGPAMCIAAAEGDGDMINGRGDAYCGMLNCSYNLGMRHLKAYIPEYPIGTAADCARMIRDFEPIARGICIGTASHALGTAKAMEEGEIEGAMSGLSIAVAGVLTVLITPLFANLI